MRIYEFESTKKQPVSKNTINAPIRAKKIPSDITEHYLGNCVNSFDSDGYGIVPGLYRTVNDFARFEEISISITKQKFFNKIRKINDQLLNQLGSNLQYLHDADNDIYMIYDMDSDIHYFFKPTTESTESNAVEGLAETPLVDFEPIGDFTKTGPFRGVDKRLVPHPVNRLKSEKFFSKTPYDIRLFFSNIPGTGRYSEYGPMNTDEITNVFGPYAPQIIKNSEDAITIVFVGNKGDAKVPLTPWVMAHRFGHAIQAGARKNKWSAWVEAEKHFFSTINHLLEECYGQTSKSQYSAESMRYDITPEYNALFNAIGTQRSSRTNKIKRPYEFLYELFAQYLKDGEIVLNPLPVSLSYGKQAWGRPTKYMRIKPEYQSQAERQDMSDMLARDMGYMFNGVMSNTVGKILVM